MENIKTCKLCLELIIKTEEFENLNCEEKQNLQILQNLEISVSKDAKICSNCVNISRLMYNFKTSCLTNNDHLKTLVHPGMKDKLILEEIMVEKSKSEFKNEKVCRFCLNFYEVNSLVQVNLQQDVVLKDMLERCLPEIDTKFVQNPLLCYICNRLLKKLYNFISQCEDREVFRNLDPKTDVLVDENTSTPTVEDNDENTNESFVKEENCDGIENPELEIKSEDFDINEDFKNSIKERNPVEEKDVTPKPRGTIKEKKFVCDICSYQTTKSSHLKQHYIIHKELSEVNLFKCDYCSFATKWKQSLRAHTIRHQNPSKLRKFKCNDCPYETCHRENLVRHGLVHKTPSQVKMYKCIDCPYETCHRANLVRHVLVHKTPSQVKMYKCKVCSFQAKYRYNIKRHEEKHQVDTHLVV